MNQICFKRIVWIIAKLVQLRMLITKLLALGKNLVGDKVYLCKREISVSLAEKRNTMFT